MLVSDIFNVQAPVRFGLLAARQANSTRTAAFEGKPDVPNRSIF